GPGLDALESAPGAVPVGDRGSHFRQCGSEAQTTGELPVYLCGMLLVSFLLGRTMKHIAIATLVLVIAPAVLAQTKAPAQTANNPVVSTVRQLEERQSKNLIGAADEMPADKYSYHPTPEQMSFAHLVMHVT